MNEAEYEAQRVERGFEMYRAVYGEDMPQPDPNASLYVGQMMRHLFAETWGREALSVRDRRLVIMGVLAASGQADKVEIQFRRAHEISPSSLECHDSRSTHHHAATTGPNHCSWPQRNVFGNC